MSVLSIIIVNWNTGGLLRECLASLRQFPPPFPYETIVVDNASDDNSLQSIGAERPGLQRIENQANRGFAVANNQGARLASAPLLLFLNPDTRVHAGTLAGAVAFMERHPGTGIMGCRTVNRDGSLQATAFTFPGTLRVFAYVAGLNRLFKLSRFTDHSAQGNPDYVQGSFLLVRREAFEKCGGFDESFFLYAEEIDFCIRARAAGYQVVYYPGISITHHGGGSIDADSGLSHFIGSIIVLYRKYRTPRQERRLRRALRLALRLRLWGGALFSPGRQAERKKALWPLFAIVADGAGRG